METYLIERHQKVKLSTYDSKWIHLYHCAPKGTAFGPLLFSLYVNDMQHTVTQNCSLKQFADDTMIFSSHSDAKQTVEKLNTNAKNLIEFFESHRLTTKTDKGEFFCFCKSYNKEKLSKIRLSVKAQDIIISKTVKNSGVSLDQNLTYQNEVKKSCGKRLKDLKLFTLYTMSFQSKHIC